MHYSGKFKPKNKDKYIGDINNIVWRSLWELSVFKWCDKNTSVKKWNSEEIKIPYKCMTDNEMHTYYVDLYIEFYDGQRFIIEIKPHNQTIPPKRKQRKSKKYIREVLNYGKNLSKWNAAERYAKKNGLIFEKWTEKTLKELGIPILQRLKK